jgi:D-arabinose 1-dehydrogenase-like Zn-dependent alcohol dehydrogenase
VSAATTRRRIDWRSDTGSGGMSLMMLVCSVALLMILGLVVDGGAKARALDHAGAIASDAARAAAATYRPGDVAIDPAVADQAAQDYLTAAGATGSVTVTGLDVSATATLKQATVFLPLVGIDAFTVTGAGQAQVVYQQGGTP